MHHRDPGHCRGRVQLRHHHRARHAVARYREVDAGRAYDLLQQFPDKNVFGPTIRSWLAAGKGTWTMAQVPIPRRDRWAEVISSARLPEEGKENPKQPNAQGPGGWSTSPGSKPSGWTRRSITEAGMLLIVVMHRWGNYARILNRLVASAGSAPTLDSMANAIKALGEWYAVGQRYVIAYRMIKNLDTKGITLAPGDSGGDNSKTVRTRPRRREIKHAGRTAPACCVSTCRTGPTPPPIPQWEASGRPTDRPEIGRRGRQEGRRRRWRWRWRR